MIKDKQLCFSEAQAITTTARSTNVIDMVATANDLGVGEDLYIVITVDTSFTAAGAATLTITIETDDNAAFSSAAVLQTTQAIGKASLTAGMEPFYICVPVGHIVSWERYLSLNYTVATGPMTAGALSACIVKDIQRWKAYPKNFVTA